jgi:glycosyltransferase involved in cell wall biosynthesis
MKNILIITQRVDEDDQLLGFFIDWIGGFAGKFEKVIMFCLEKGSFNFPRNVEVISLGKDRKLSKIAWLFNFYKNGWKRRNEYDAVFVHMNAIWVVVGAWFWHILGKKVFLWYAHKTITWKHRIAEKMADGIFASTPEGFRLPSQKLIIVGQGINVDLFRPDPSKRPIFLALLSVGRIAPVKNYETLIDAAKLLNDRRIDFFVTVVGAPAVEGDEIYEQKLKDRVKTLDLESRFNFVGKVSNRNLPPYYQSHHIYINLSRTGSLDKTIVEAMACGCAVLSSNDSAMQFLPPELVVSDKDPEELARKIQEVAGRDYGRQLREYVVENHSLDKLIEKISAAIYKKL